jgi:hypothetical protein
MDGELIASTFALPAGAHLVPGTVYLNLARPDRGPFRALRGQIAGSRDRYVSRASMSTPEWHALIVACAAWTGRGALAAS